MKLTIDCRMLGSGGIGTYLESLLPYFIKNYECLLIGRENDISKFSQYKNVTLCNCEINPFSLKEFFSFPQNITNQINKTDIYYTPYCNIPSGIKITIYSTIHDVVFLDVKGLTGKIGTFARKFFYQHAINKSKIIFTVSDFSKQRIIANLSTKKKPIIVTYNSVPQWFLENQQNLSKTKENYILFVGNIKKHKGLHTLLDAFEILQKDDFPSKLVLVGNAQNFRTGDNTIFTKINSFTEGKIEFTGKISNPQLKNYYSKARLLIQPSFYEGFGMPPLEALYCGTNVILSDIPVFKEIYKDFPVTFFECGNANDLAQKIKKNYNNENPTEIPNKYSFEKTFEIIKGNLK